MAVRCGPAGIGISMMTGCMPTCSLRRATGTTGTTGWGILTVGVPGEVAIGTIIGDGIMATIGVDSMVMCGMTLGMTLTATTPAGITDITASIQASANLAGVGESLARGLMRIHVTQRWHLPVGVRRMMVRWPVVLRRQHAATSIRVVLTTALPAVLRFA